MALSLVTIGGKITAAVINALIALPTTYTPSLTNCTLGTTGSILNGDYTISGGGIVTGWVDITLGTGGGISGTLIVGLPVPAVTGHPHIGTFFAAQGTAASGRTFGAAELNSTADVILVSSSGPIIAAGTPAAWVSGNSIRFQFCYKAA
ncbi:MAG TPA: hypothetical protein VIO16_11035 [Dehalococcoidia bacterium]